MIGNAGLMAWCTGMVTICGLIVGIFSIVATGDANILISTFAACVVGLTLSGLFYLFSARRRR